MVGQSRIGEMLELRSSTKIRIYTSIEGTRDVSVVKLFFFTGLMINLTSCNTAHATPR